MSLCNRTAARARRDIRQSLESVRAVGPEAVAGVVGQVLRLDERKALPAQLRNELEGEATTIVAMPGFRDEVAKSLLDTVRVGPGCGLGQGMS